MEAHKHYAFVERGKCGRLKLSERELDNGEELEVLWRGRWMRGRVEYVQWRFLHRLRIGECSIELTSGMQARRVLEETLIPDPSPEDREKGALGTAGALSTTQNG
jgi:hypothetical protein